MAKRSHTNRQRAVRLVAASVGFLIGATLIIVFVIRGYLQPAYEAWSKADPQQRSLLSASSTLLMAVVLVLLLLLLIAAFGVRRFFHFGQHSMHRSKTPYIDAWSESARRMKTPAGSNGDDTRADGDRDNS